LEAAIRDGRHRAEGLLVEVIPLHLMFVQQHSISKGVSPVSGPGENAGGPVSPSPGCFFSRHGRVRLWRPLIPLETSWFLRSSTLHVLATPISERNRATPGRPEHSRLCGSLAAHAGLVHYRHRA